MNPNENKNDCMGEIACESCGGVAYVYRNKKKLLYTRCGECGCDQRTGKAVQERFSKFLAIGSIALASENISELSEVLSDETSKKAAASDKASEKAGGEAVEEAAIVGEVITSKSSKSRVLLRCGVALLVGFCGLSVVLK